MLSLINLIIGFLWFLSAAADYADFCHIWQLKEYRWDRFRDFLSTEQGKNFWIKYALLWRSVIAIIIFFWPINSVPAAKYLLLMIFIIDLFYNLYRYFKKHLRYPIPTVKAIIIIFLSLSIEGIIFIITRDWTLPLILLILRFALLSTVVLALKLPFGAVKRYLIHLAREKINRYPNLLVIGITGSYGKTSVKNFLYHLLSVKYKVVKTPKNINTEIGNALFILKTDFAGIDVFIVEMGAYRPKEISAICRIVKPKIGILTAINEQHLALFGDIKITQKTKYELFQALPKDGLAITNADYKLCTEYLKQLHCQVKTFGAEEENKPDVLIKQIEKTPDGIKGVFKTKTLEFNIFAPLKWEHNIMNITPCLIVALHLGMNLEEITERAKTLVPPTGILETKKYGRCIILDDSYNSNPDGFKVAIQVLNSYPPEWRKIIITRGMLELGKESEKLHQQIGEEISFTADELVIITKDFAEPLTRGMGNKSKTNIVFKFNHAELTDYLKNIKNTKSVILLENRMPSEVYKEINEHEHKK